MSKISKNPSNQEFMEQVNTMKNILPLLKILNFFGIVKEDNFGSQLLKLQEDILKAENLMKMIDDFNLFFSNLGWIAYKRMSIDIIEESVKLHNNGEIEKANELLIEYYSPDNIRKIINWIYNSKIFKLRQEQLQVAFERYENKDYISCIPILLIAIDGGVQNIVGSGFFSSKTDLEVWDSIAGHTSGLASIKNIWYKSRKKVNNESINIPFRNGIMHGIDINYGNSEVAAKCWGIMFALTEWAEDCLNEEKRKNDYNAKQYERNKPIFKQIIESIENLRNTNYYEKLVEAWKPRKIEIGVTVPISGKSDEYGKNTPEKKTIHFFELINKGNYGYMYDCLYKKITNKKLYYENKYDNNYIKILREDFKNIKIINYEIINIEDEAPAITNVLCNVKVVRTNIEFQFNCNFRMIYVVDGEISLRDIEHGEWLIIGGDQQLLFNV